MKKHSLRHGAIIQFKRYRVRSTGETVYRPVDPVTREEALGEVRRLQLLARKAASILRRLGHAVEAEFIRDNVYPQPPLDRGPVALWYDNPRNAGKALPE